MDSLRRAISDARDGAGTGIRHAKAIWAKLSTVQRVAVVAGVLVLGITAMLILIYHAALLAMLVRFSDWWRELKYGGILLFTLLLIVAFPPLIGYSTLASLAGMVYGFPGGWPILAGGTVIGSFLSFLTFRYLLHDRAMRLASTSTKFAALTRTLEQSKFTLLWLIRLCPLPYSLSNGAISSIPSVKPWPFLVATACTTPKLLIHVFVGDRLTKMGTEKDTASKIVDALSILLASLAGFATTYIIYTRTMALAQKMDTEDYAELESTFDQEFELSSDSDAEPLDDDVCQDK
jgi:uncharacterized membrane protein YdjX (TVP38/TMEM64 family)